MIPVRVLNVNHTAVANLKSNLFHIGRNEMHELFSIYQAGTSIGFGIMRRWIGRFCWKMAR